MKEKRFIAITSIFSPTEGVLKFSNFDDWETIVVADKKTPVGWECENTTFISVSEQNRLGYKILNTLPYNHYSRKMIAYVSAIKQGAEMIADTDDDNIPKPNWAALPCEGHYLTTQKDMGFVNIYTLFTDQRIWPRGFPLKRITDGSVALSHSALTPGNVKVGIWQGLVDDDPDVDAIYRLTDNRPCFFEKRDPVVLNRGTICPFNSQNTVFCAKELFPLLYLPAFVNFRFTDIMRGLVAQPIMWTKGYLLGFSQSTAVQERNVHDYLKDFEDEIPCYLNAERVVDLVGGTANASMSIGDNLYLAYHKLVQAGIAEQAELLLLSDWLKDLS